jgi:hypothetical protein
VEEEGERGWGVGGGTKWGVGNDKPIAVGIMPPVFLFLFLFILVQRGLFSFAFLPRAADQIQSIKLRFTSWPMLGIAKEANRRT